MTENLRFIPASTLSLEVFAELFTATFAHYFYEMVLTQQSMSDRVRIEQLDLFRSVVLLSDDRPVGQATLGLRGSVTWCGGFGLIPAYRGKQLGLPLLNELIRQARAAGAKQLGLEVLQANTAAQALYFKAGFQHQRDLRLLKWLASSAPASSAPGGTRQYAPVNLAEVARHFHRLHPVTPAWSRDLPTLMLLPNLLQLTHVEQGVVQGYVLFKETNGVLRIYDLAARDEAVAVVLLRELQVAAREIYSVNEASDSPFVMAYDACGFQEYDRQLDLQLSLVKAV